jgi:formylmethanofuran:tetrahydromethanopterin formyltransferase
MSFQNISLNEDEQRNRAYAALLAPPKKPIEIDYSKEILAELKKMNELMREQNSTLKKIEVATAMTATILEGVRVDGVLRVSECTYGAKFGDNSIKLSYTTS